MSAVPSILATVVLWLWISGSHNLHTLLTFIPEPMQVARIGYFPVGFDANLMDIGQRLLPSIPAQRVDAATLVLATVVCFFVLYRATRIGSVQAQVALMAIMSYSLFRHHSYDSVVLLLPLCYGLRLWHDTRAKVVVTLIAYLWYGQRLFDIVFNYFGSPLVIVQFVMLIAILVLTYSLQAAEQRIEPSWHAPHNPTREPRSQPRLIPT